MCLTHLTSWETQQWALCLNCLYSQFVSEIDWLWSHTTISCSGAASLILSSSCLSLLTPNTLQLTVITTPVRTRPFTFEHIHILHQCSSHLLSITFIVALIWAIVCIVTGPWHQLYDFDAHRSSHVIPGKCPMCWMQLPRHFLQSHLSKCLFSRLGRWPWTTKSLKWTRKHCIACISKRFRPWVQNCTSALISAACTPCSRYIVMQWAMSLPPILNHKNAPGMSLIQCICMIMGPSVVNHINTKEMQSSIVTWRMGLLVMNASFGKGLCQCTRYSTDNISLCSGCSFTWKYNQKHHEHDCRSRPNE